MHGLLVTIALLFFLTALLAILKMLYVERNVSLFYAGLVCLASLLACAVIYYGNVFFSLLPAAQKLTFAVCAGWLLALHFVEFKPDDTASKA